MSGGWRWTGKILLFLFVSTFPDTYEIFAEPVGMLQFYSHFLVEGKNVGAKMELEDHDHHLFL